MLEFFSLFHKKVIDISNVRKEQFAYLLKWAYEADYYKLPVCCKSHVDQDNKMRYKFTAKERDEEKSYDYFGARYYNSDTGRSMAVDPLADKYPGWSPYNYCRNNPLNRIDPDGLRDIKVKIHRTM